jgi:hypothetical protein
MAGLHRQIEQRHVDAAKIHELHAGRMARWLTGADGAVLRPAFMSAVATILGTPSAAATLHGRRQAAVLVAATDFVAQAAHDAEVIMGEGPATEAVSRCAPVSAAGAALTDRWPHYGPAVAELGVRAVIAAPLGLPATSLGALCAYDTEPRVREEVAKATVRTADVLTYSLLGTPKAPGSDLALSALAVLDSLGDQAIVHQATGMVSVQCQCGIDDASVLLAARAFADDVPIEQLAASVVQGDTRLC